MVRNKNYRLTEEGLHWSNIIEEDIAELIREMREQNMSYEDISHLLLLGVTDSMRVVLIDENRKSYKE